MSIAGGLPRSVERALSVEATALQIFVKSSRQWRARELSAAEIDRFRRATEAAGLARHLVAHASYLINPASSRRDLWERSVQALAVEVDRCAALGIPLLVVHPGSHDGRGVRAGLRRVARAADRVFMPRSRRTAVARRAVSLLLETTAGAGRVLGSKFEELGAVIGQARCAERLGVCFDTCHVLAAGYEFRDRRSYRETLRHFERTIGLQRLKAFHLNDSRYTLGSRRDRHEHIGRGHVGLEAFRLLLNDRRFGRRPMVLETPKGPELAEDRQNLNVLRAMIKR